MDGRQERFHEDPNDSAREELYRHGVRAFPDIPDLADRWLKALGEEDALPTTGPGLKVRGKELVSPARENPANRSSEPQVSHAVLENGQTLWVRRARRRTSRGYRPVGVVDRPGRSTMAMLAALTVLEGRKANPARLAAVLPFVEPRDQESIGDSLHRTFEDTKNRCDGAGLLADDLMLERPLQYAHALLRYYRPGFDDLPEEDRRELLQGCCARINAVLNSTRQLAGFLEYGAAGKDQRPGLGNPRCDVEAAVLREVEGMKYREISDVLGVEISENSPTVEDFSTVGKMVRRGRKILEEAYGHDGWDELAASMKREFSQRDPASEEG
jgi:hypothetical protein